MKYGVRRRLPLQRRYPTQNDAKMMRLALGHQARM